MIALDTNVLARLLLRDDARQHERALQLLGAAETFTAPATVMLELVWVLEANDCSVPDIVQGLELLLGLPNFQPSHPEALRRALALYVHGMDFADALHLCLSGASVQLTTFDKSFVKLAKRLGASPPVAAL